MNTIDQYRQELYHFLQKLRHKIILEKSIRFVVLFLRFFPVYILFTLMSEAVFYLRTDFRKILFLTYPAVLLLFIVFLLFQYFTINLGLFRRYQEKNVAKIFSKFHPRTGNRFLDSLQLLHSIDKQDSGMSADLILESLRITTQEIRGISLKNLLRRHNLLKGFTNSSLVFSLVLLIFFSNFQSLSESYYRIKNFNHRFPVPTPFSIEALSGNLHIFGGDTIQLEFQAKGNFPDELTLSLNYSDFKKTNFLPLDSNGYGKHPLVYVTQDFEYEAFVINHSVFKPWKKISSGAYRVHVQDRPEILEVITKIQFPEYTDIEEKIKESNNSEYFVMPGSKVLLSATVNKPVREAWLDFKNHKDIQFAVSGNQIYSAFEVINPMEYKFLLTDANNVNNINPINYKIKITPDEYPAINLLAPREDFQLSELMEIPLYLRIGDDFGFTGASIRYKLLKKYSENSNEEHEVGFPVENKDLILQELSYDWNVSDLNLAPEDRIEFYIEIFDNDVISGPKKATTRKISAFFPSLNDLFANISEKQEKAEESGEEILDKLLSSKEILEDISNKLLKDPKLTWEQKEQLQQEMQKTAEAGEDLKQLAEQLDQIQQQGEENQLFSDETIKKYAELQEAMQNLMSPELQKAMQELQKAIENIDQQNIERALEKFQTTHDEFSEELDRMLQLMKRVQIEQALDELVKRIDDLTKRQDSVSQQLKNNPPKENPDWNALQKEEKSIENDTRIFDDQLQRTAELMQDFPMMNPAGLENIQQNLSGSGLFDDLENSQTSMQMRNSLTAQENSQQAKEKLSDLQQQMKDFQQQFQQNAMAEVTADFQKLIMKTLHLSQMQESLNHELGNVSVKSEQITDLAKKQNRYRNNLTLLIENMTALSQKTFGLASESTKHIGQVANEMQQAMQAMTERNPYSAGSHGNKAKTALNKLSFSLMESMQKLQESGQSSGFQNYMQQMEQLAQQQQGLNQQTQQEGQGMPKPQPGGRKPGSMPSFQQLAARQKQIQQSLEKLQQQIEQESANQAGTLKGIAQDMDDVIKDLQNNQVLRKTIERQQKILTRMLDAQKSLRTQSYKKERESTTGKDLEKIPPGELPRDLGERNLVLRQKLEEALKNGYTAEYKDIIRKYFEELSKEETEVEK
ncbi:MAG: hypothetical protein JXQ65_05380 [Candidatus Marinimicrobia bacterium]|nr:hypothetical protein [Candidatus Neomarinimicrobiota bacterium]